MLKTLLLLILLTWPAAAAAQNHRLRVQVHHEKQPVPSAEVVVGTVRGMTDSSGAATLLVSAGEKQLRISGFGYSPYAAVIRMPAADTTIMIELEPQAEELEEIVVLSTRTGKRIEDQPIRVEVLAGEEIEEKTMMTPGDIAMMLNETGGLRVQITTPSLAAANVRVQGLRGRYTQLLSDGLPLYGGQSGALGLLQIPPLDLGQVEVIKGAASALYGAAALGGVINLISRRPDGAREILLNLTTLGGTDAMTWLSGDLNEQWSYSLIGSAHRQSRADIDDDGWADLPRYERLVARPRVFWKNDAGASLFVTAGATVEDRAGGTSADVPRFTFIEALDTRRADAGAVAILPLGDRIVNVRASAMTQRHEHRFGQVTENDTHRTAFAEATLRGLARGHTWLVGAALQGDSYHARDVDGFDYRFTAPSVFAQDEFSVADVTLSLSARSDWHSEYGTFVTPRLSTLFRPGDVWSYRLSIGSGYYAPTPFTEETEAIGLSALAPLRDLKAERAVTLSFDVNRTKGPLELNATVFGAVLEEAIQLRGSIQSGDLRLENSVGDARTRGTELLLRYRPPGYHFTASHTYVHATELSPDAPVERTVPLTPRHAIGVVGMKEWEERGRVAFELYYTGEQALDENPYRTSSKPYLVFGLLGQWQFGKARVFVNAENLLDARQTRYDPLIRPSLSRQGRWTVDAWAPLEGRAINAGVRIGW